jgi:RNA recognition motif-containing protein
MKLFVAGLPYDLDDQELNDIFAEYGTVDSAKVILDRETRKSRGFGFVEFADASQAQAAMEALDGAELSGKKMTVKQAEERAPRPGGGREGRPGGFNKPGGGGSRDRNRY